MRKSLQVLTAGLAAGTVLAAPAAAAPGPAEFSFGFSTLAAGAVADAKLHIHYFDPRAPEDPDSPPPALTEVIIAAPAGTVFDGGARPACTASDTELRLLGSAACPEQSKLGEGFGAVMLTAGPRNPFVLDATLFDYGDGVLEMFTFPGTGITAATDRARFEGPSTMVLHPAVVPGITEREFSWTYRGAGVEAGRPFLRTPSECPASGSWTSRLTYTVTTGATYSVASSTPCTPALVQETPAIQASLTPRRVRAGHRARIRVQLASTDARCVANATARLGNRYTMRTDSAGRATIAARFSRPARLRLVASNPGCSPGRATLVVVRGG
jgi:hypothetical protein